MDWKSSRVLVTGGASFIGSHLVDRLVSLGARVRVVDNLSSGRLDNIRAHVEAGRVEFRKGDLLEDGVAAASVDGIDLVFHLAADHGGRGYVDLHQAECATNLSLDGGLFRQACRAGVKKIVFASSACVYPLFLQKDPEKELYLSEEQVGPPYEADNLYGWAKLMGEMTLKAYHQKYGIQAASCRFFTVYGPRCVENHAVLAMIARAFVRQDPFEVWGTGKQIRNWTHVSDIVAGLILAAERVEDGSAVNLGTTERIRVEEAARLVLEYTGHRASLRFRPDLPTGPYNRTADISRARRLLGWEPKISFRDGLRETIRWYYETQRREEVSSRLERALIERTTAPVNS